MKAACFLKTQGYQILSGICRSEIQINKRKRSAGRSRRSAETATDLPGGSLVSDRERSGYLYTVQIRCGGDCGRRDPALPGCIFLPGLKEEIRETETSANMEKTDRKSFKKDEIQKTNSQYQKIKQYSRRADYGHSLETGIYRRYGSQTT